MNQNDFKWSQMTLLDLNTTKTNQKPKITMCIYAIDAMHQESNGVTQQLSKIPCRSVYTASQFF